MAEAGADVKEERNLSVIQRLDKDVVRVIGYASHVVVYIFNEEEKSWDREEIEGTLFVVLRSSLPWHRVMVINRLNPKNLIAPIDEEFEFEERDPFLIFKNSSGIRGVWFSKDEERPRIAHVFQAIDPGPPEQGAEAAKPSDEHTQIKQDPQVRTQPQAHPQAQAQPPPPHGQPRPQLQQQQGGMSMMGMMPGAGHGQQAGMHPFYPRVPLQQFQQMSMSPRPHPVMGFPMPYPGQPVQPPSHGQPRNQAAVQSNAQDPLILSKQQLQEVLLKLIKNDRFIDLLHNEYLKTQDKRRTKDAEKAAGTGGGA